MAIYMLEDDEAPEIHIIGVACHENNYRMCWLLNTTLEVVLTRAENPLKICVGEERESEHTYFEGVNDLWKSQLYLIQNRSDEGQFLLPEKKVADYLVVLKSPKETYTQEVLGKLRVQNLILTAFRIQFEDLKSKSNLIF